MNLKKRSTEKWLPNKWPKSSNLVKKWSIDQQAEFFTLLANLLKIGFSLTAALDFIVQTNKRMRPQVNLIVTRLKSGNGFSESVRSLINIGAYHQLLISEKHGRLKDVLKELAKFDRLKIKQIKKIKSMMVYPLFLCLILFVLMIMIRLFVFPQIQELMPNIHQSTSLTRNFRLIKYFLIGIILLTGISFVYWFTQSPIRKVQLLIKLPLIGKLFQNYVAYYLASNLATLLKSGLSVREISITLAEFDKGSLIYSLGAKLDAALTDGQSLADVVDEAQFVPNEIIKFLNSGDPITEMANAMTAYSSLMFEEMMLTTNKIIVFIQPSMFIVIGITIVGTYFQLLTET